MRKKLKIKADCKGLLNEEIIETILENRDVKDVDEFLNPSLDNNLLPLDDLKNIDKAVDIIVNSVKNKLKIGIYADVDLDGICSCTIMQKYLKWLCVEPIIYANKGKEHGVSSYNLKKIIEDKVDTLIIVDSLDGTIENYKTLKENGVEVIVIDHHFISPDIPYEDYVTLVSSQNEYGNPSLCGAGTTWKVTLALDAAIGGFESQDLADLAMAGTIGDMMDVSQNSMENRAIVNEGLNHLQNTTLQKLGGGYDFNSKTIAFSVAPKINAAMRLNENDSANKAFLSEDEKDINKYSRLLLKCKDKQNDEVDRIYDDAISQCNKQLDNKMMVVIIDSQYSINGLLGNKLMETYKRPILVLSERFNKYQGSMRACGVKDFRKMLEDTGLCEAKGHELASGVEISYNNFDKFRKVMESKLANIEFSQELEVDAEINLEDVNSDLIHMVKQVDRISGMNFPALTFMIEIDDFRVEKASKGKHLCIRTPNMLFIKWNFNNDDMYEKLQDAELMGDSIKCIGTLDGSYVYGIYNKMICDEIIV